MVAAPRDARHTGPMATAEAQGTGRAVVVVGAINVDLVVAAPRLPAPGETVVGPRVERHGGGKGANAAVAAARAGASVHLIGAVGADDVGTAAVAELGDEGIDTGDVAVLEGEATGVALIVVDPAGENQIAVGAGANDLVAVDHVRRALGRQVAPAPGCVLVSTEIPGAAVEAAVRAAIDAGITCVLNTAPVRPEVVSLLALGPILTPNETELSDLVSALGGQLATTVEANARAVAAHTRAPVVVTVGGDGVVLVRADGSVARLPAPDAVVRDTTGAGDTFNGVLATRLAAGDSLEDAVHVALTAASLSVEHLGARDGMPPLERIREALAEG